MPSLRENWEFRHVVLYKFLRIFVAIYRLLLNAITVFNKVSWEICKLSSFIFMRENLGKMKVSKKNNNKNNKFSM